MFCEDCGTQIDSTSQFCSHCGARFTTRLAEARTGEQPLPSHRNNKPTKRLQTILVLSIPAGLIALVVVWLLSGVVESRREGFEKFLPENTAYYVEIHDPIGLVADFEQSAFYKRLTASPEWKEADISNSDLRKFKDVLSRLTAVRNVVGPAGLASVPSFSETGALVFVRIEIDRSFGGLDRSLVQRLYYLIFLQKPPSRRFDLKFQFDFFSREHDFVISNPPIVNSFQEGPFRNNIR